MSAASSARDPYAATSHLPTQPGAPVIPGQVGRTPVPAQRTTEPQHPSEDAEIPDNVVPLRESDRAFLSPSGGTDNVPIGAAATRWWAEWPFMIVAAELVVALIVALTVSLTVGVATFGVAAATAFVLRAVLPDQQAGMLKVRSRAVDLCILGLAALAMFLVAASIPAA